MLPLCPGDELTVEGWLSRFDSHPVILPAWPDSSRMACVMCRRTAGGETEGWVLLHPDELEAAADPQHVNPALFFKIPKVKLLEPGVCPGLTSELFWHSPG